jgi:hypothetical protein
VKPGKFRDADRIRVERDGSITIFVSPAIR